VLAFVVERSPREVVQLGVERRLTQRVLVERDLGVLELEHELQDLGVLRARRRSCSVPEAGESTQQRRRRGRCRARRNDRALEGPPPRDAASRAVSAVEWIFTITLEGPLLNQGVTAASRDY
jgi:hypothetical protein